MFSNLVRVLVLYLIVLISIRLMGKRQIGELSPFEFVITLLIAELAAIPMAERTVPLLYGAIPVLTLLIVHTILTLLIKNSIFMRKIINGKPVILIDKNGIDFKALKSLNMNLNNLTDVVRGAGYLSLSEVNYCICETTGKFSVFPKFASTEVTNKNLKIIGEEPQLPIMLICEKKFVEENLSLFLIKKEHVLKMAKDITKRKLTEKEILIFTLTNGGDCYIQEINNPAISTKINLKTFKEAK